MKLKLTIHNEEFIVHQTKNHIHVDKVDKVEKIALNQLKPLIDFDLESPKATTLLLREGKNFYAKIKNDHFQGTLSRWTEGALTKSPLDQSITDGSIFDGTIFDGTLRSPFAGKITKIFSRKGLKVKAESPLMVVEAMKMEYEVASPVSARVEKILVSMGDQVSKDQILAVLKRGQ